MAPSGMLRRAGTLASVLIAVSVEIVTPSQAAAPVMTGGDSQLYSPVPFGQSPPNGFWFLNNVFGKGSFVNGRDYLQTLVARPDTFPSDSIMEWSWPDAGSGSAFAFAFPLICYGRTEYGNPYNVVGPWPQKVDDIKTLVVDYDISLGGNLDSYDVLLDIFLTAAAETDGTHVVEFSFFPHMNNLPLLGTKHTFSFGEAYVGSQGKQILIQPSSGESHRDMLSGSVNLREVFSYLKLIGLLSGDEWMQGVQFGPEVQVPASFNSTPHQGTLQVHRLFYDWK